MCIWNSAFNTPHDQLRCCHGKQKTPVWRSSISHTQSPAKTSTRIFATGGEGDSDTCHRDNVVTWQRRLRLLSRAQPEWSPRGETTPEGVWHQQYTHNYVWSLKLITSEDNISPRNVMVSTETIAEPMVEFLLEFDNRILTNNQDFSKQHPIRCFKSTPNKPIQ